MTEAWGVIHPKCFDDGKPDWLMICEGHAHAVMVTAHLKALSVDAFLVRKHDQGWHEVLAEDRWEQDA